MNTKEDNNVTDHTDVVYTEKQYWIIVTDRTRWQLWWKLIHAQSVYQLIHVQLVLLDWGSNQQNL